MEGYIAQIKLFAANFAPRNWAYCQGQVISISQNTALFSLLGTTYGGNGQTTFQLPNFAGRVAVGAGQGQGLPMYQLGEMSGSENTTLNVSHLPAHTHTITTTTKVMGSSVGGGDEIAGSSWAAGANAFSNQKGGTMNAGAVNVNLNVAAAGASYPIGNAQPSLGMNYIICMYGIFPSRN